MGRFVLHHEDEGFFFVALGAEPLLGLVGDDLADVASFPVVAFGCDEVGIVVAALAGEDFPVVETGGLTGKVPFANQGGLITDFLEELGKGLLGTVELGGFVFVEAVEVAVFAGQDGGYTGSQMELVTMQRLKRMPCLAIRSRWGVGAALARWPP